MTIAVGILLGALSGGLLAYFITRQPNEIVLTQLPPYARMIRDSVMTLAHEIEVVSDKQFKNEIVLMDGEQLGPDRDPQSIFALTPNAGFCFVESLKPIPAAFAAVEQTLYRDGQMGRMVTSGYEEVAVEYHSLLGMRWVLNAHKYRDGVDLSGGQRFHICLYGLRKVDPLVMNRLRNALDKAEAKLMATPIRLSR